MATLTCDRYSIVHKLSGVNSHEAMPVVERTIGLCKLTAMRNKTYIENEGLNVSDDLLIAEAAMTASLCLI